MIRYWTIVAVILMMGMVFMAFSLYRFQESLIFFPEKLPLDYEFAFPKASFEEVTINVESAQLHALHFKSQNSKGVIFYLHGNAGNLGSWGHVAFPFIDFGYDVFILDYRGYGKSTEKIESEKQLLEDCIQAYQYIEKQYRPEQIILFGRSIGTGPLIYIASQKYVSKVILETPYSSLIDLAKIHFPIIPSILLKYKLNAIDWVRKVKAPIYIFHGTEDDVIPIEIGKRLSQSIQGEHEFNTIAGGNHNNLSEYQEYWDKMRRILP
jgi:uncharacterized protein